MARKAMSLSMVLGVGLAGAFVRASEIADANELFVLEKYEDAIVVYENVVSGENQEKAAEALFGMARACQMLGRWKLARDSFERLLRDYPGSELASWSRIQLGQCEVKLGNLRRALAVFKETEEKYAGEEAAIEAKYHIANLNVGFFGDDVRKARAAITGYHGVLNSEQGRRYVVQSNFGLGQCYLILRDYPRAIESFRVVLEKGPETVWANYARDQIVGALRAFGDEKLSESIEQWGRLWADFPPSLMDSFRAHQRFAWRWPGGMPALRIYAIGLSTEPVQAGSGAMKVVYVKPTMYYKNYIFSSGRGTVDRVRRSVECVGRVTCTDAVLPPTLTVTSGALRLHLTLDRAVFSQNVKFEKRAGERTVQQLLVEELHLMLDSGKIEVPPGKAE